MIFLKNLNSNRLGIITRSNMSRRGRIEIMTCLKDLRKKWWRPVVKIAVRLLFQQYWVNDSFSYFL
jgi:hypothetical protein